MGSTVLSVLIAALAILPVLMVASALLSPTPDIWIHLWNTLLPEMLRNTLLLLLGVGVGTLVLGAGLAWLVTAYDFPGRALFQWLLMLPMAVPAYIMGFVFMATFDVAGPVQGALVDGFGSAAWFPEVRSPLGAITVMTLVLYPYVYMLALVGYRGISASGFDTAQVHGYSRAYFYWKVVLPISRPAIAAGVALALMEALADFATVRFFNFPTLADGVVRIWHGMMDLQAASELAGLLAIVALGALLIERSQRGRTRYHETGGKAPRIPRAQFRGQRKWWATAVCAGVVGVAFVLPISQLITWAWIEFEVMTPGMARVYLELAGNSLFLATLAAAVAVLFAIVLSSGVRVSGQRWSRIMATLATTGYAIPGPVLAVGILMTLTPLDHALNYATEYWAGVTVGLVLTGSVFGLVYGYVARFLAVAYQSTDAALEKVKPNLSSAARTLGAGPWRILTRIHLPLAAPGIIVAAALVFVDVMKELPITIMLRPFGYETLATWVWQMSAESIWSGAAVPALGIVLAGLLPVVLLIKILVPK
ncbi:MAG: iron ABC transporter permease [Serpentinimonas sp.]|nr:iron ABC transporter permease [Serpentinimonas sp.]